MTEFEKHIDNYLNSRLSPSDHEAFESKMKMDEELRNEVEVYRDIENVLGIEKYKSSNEASTKGKEYLRLLTDTEGEKVFEAISDADEKYFAENKKPKGRSKFVYFVIGAFVLALIGLFYWMSRPKLSNKQILASLNDYSSLPSLTNRNEQQELANGEAFFVEGKYREALEIFETYSSRDTSLYNSQVELYKACCLVELSQYDKAIMLLLQLSKGTSMDSGIAKWYLVQAYVKSNNSQGALQVLHEIISNKNNFKYKEAKELQAILQTK